MICTSCVASLAWLLAATSPLVASGLFCPRPAVISATVAELRSSRTRPSDSRILIARNAVSDAFGSPEDDPEQRSRRDLLRAALVVPAGAFLLSPSFPASTTAGPKVTPLPSVDAALDLIDRSCNRRFLHAVVASDYNFLYRGLPSGGIDAQSPTIRVEPCDLLDPETYGSEEAASYFRKLDESMKSNGSPILPSNGHLGVTCPKAAAEWGGIAASVWPLGGDDDDDGGVHFAWFESGGEFWPRQTKSGGAAADGIIVDGVDCGRLSLDDALVGDRWEVMFRADRGFLAVPSAFDAQLREGLRQSFLM